ncbi:hypothetical protein VTO42DRAFT_390 [Malbranchea cinnamomea]
MGKLRVLSLISGRRNHAKKNGNLPEPILPVPNLPEPAECVVPKQHNNVAAPPSPPQHVSSVQSSQPPLATRRSDRLNGRPLSALFPSQQVPLADVEPEPTPELEPIFSYLNLQANKLYYEGYLLRLNDLDSQGRPCPDRQWVECFAQLIGSVIWMWDAAALDEAGEYGDVHPTHINVADASLSMVEVSPKSHESNQPVQKVLSISTAGKNRYLLHFNSLNALTQWTAAIRLTMYENTLLQESYTGALIAGKGKYLNNIKTILERTRFKYEDWVRVRFSPGTPWKRCWCVITPPDEKEKKKLLRAQKKKKSAYERSTVVVKGSVKFYETKKTKKTKPLVTITDAYSAFALYPQSRSLVDQSTLVKIEGQMTIHSKVESKFEGFVFVLPELHPAVSGLEIMLRFLFPVFDTFHLYGRPNRLLADTFNTRSLMFAMPSGRRVAYLDNLDVASLLHTEGSPNWSEQEWRRRMKEATARRMASNSTHSNSRASSVIGSRYHKSSTQGRNGMSVRFGDAAIAQRLENNHSTDAVFSAGYRHSLAGNGHATSDSFYNNGHGRGTSPSRTSLDRAVPEEVEEQQQQSPQPREIPQYDGSFSGELISNNSRSSGSSDSPRPNTSSERGTMDQLRPNTPLASIETPPKFIHNPRDMPQHRPQPSSELRRANSRVSYGTLSQLVEMSRAREAAVAETRNYEKEGQTANHTPKLDLQQTLEAPKTAPPASPVSPLPSDVEYHSPDMLSRPVSVEYSSAQQVQASPQKPTNRKPVPQEVNDVETRSTTTTASSLGSLRNAIDVDALNLAMARQRTPSPPPRRIPQAQVRDEESVYDQSSVTSPDYASSRESSVSKRSSTSVQRPRMGVKKVVGTQDPSANEVVIGDARYKRADPDSVEPNPDIPTIDFGPTHTLSPTTRRPSTSDTLKLFGHSRNRSDATLVANEKRVSSHGRTTPGPAIDSRRPETPGHGEQRRSILWQPGMANGHNSPGSRMSMSPEQFVQQRAEAASPVYSHRRISSRVTSTSHRPTSGDWTTYVHQQLIPRERPHSRGPSATLSQLDLSSRLSAREQEHVARVTGSSFFNLSNEANKSQPILGTGLVGAIDAREREREAIKEGFGGHMVQQAIAQRQYQSQWSGPPQSHYAPSSYGIQAHHRHNDSDTVPCSQLPRQPAYQQTWGQQPRPMSQQAFYGHGSSTYPESIYQPRPASQQAFYHGPAPSMYHENQHSR